MIPMPMELKSYSYKIEAQKQKCLLLHDSENQLLEIRENGSVNLETVMTLRKKATKLIEEKRVKKLLLNRRWLGEYSKEARTWIIEEYYKGQKQILKEQIELVATVKPVDKIGCIYSHLLSTNIKFFLPTVSLVDFEQEGDAMAWLLNL